MQSQHVPALARRKTKTKDGGLITGKVKGNKGVIIYDRLVRARGCPNEGGRERLEREVAGFTAGLGSISLD